LDGIRACLHKALKLTCRGAHASDGALAEHSEETQKEEAWLNVLLASGAVSGTALANGLGNSLPAVTGVGNVFSQQPRATPEVLHAPVFAQPNEAALKQVMSFQFTPEVAQMPPLGLPGIGVSPEVFAPLQNSAAA
uniref:EGR3 n=1 Tax=Hydatigena taeniaeformis TaxID=6205 RepID=A0A0R3XC45_HYDTA